MVVGAVVLLLALSACSGRQVIPRGYGDTTSKNFQKGCVATAGSKEVQIDNPAGVCRCAYDRVVKEIPFSEFKKVNSKLQDKPGPLPANFVKIITDCEGTGSAPTTTSTSTSAPG